MCTCLINDQDCFCLNSTWLNLIYKLSLNNRFDLVNTTDRHRSKSGLRRAIANNIYNTLEKIIIIYIITFALFGFFFKKKGFSFEAKKEKKASNRQEFNYKKNVLIGFAK